MKGGFGTFEVTLFPDAFHRYAHLVRSGGPYEVEGGVESQYGAITITARRIAILKG